MLDQSKKKLNKKVKVQDELGTFETLSYEARVVLQGLAEQFVENCFNRALPSVLKIYEYIYLTSSLLRSLPRESAEGYSRRTCQSHREGQLATPLCCQVVHGVFRRITGERGGCKKCRRASLVIRSRRHNCGTVLDCVDAQADARSTR